MSTPSDRLAQLDEAAAAIRARCPQPPRAAIVLGSGLGAFADRLEDAVSLSYGEIPHWPVSSVVGHAGRLVVGRLGTCPVAALSGRVHAYEGHDHARVVFATRVMARLGVRYLVLTNAAGGVRTTFKPGDLMVIDDHLNLSGSNPLVGANDERLGPRFPDMSEVYAAGLRALADRVGADMHISLVHGVYAGLLGPSYETPAEIRYLRTIGADAVGMSTVAEAIAARHAGLEVLGISCISNMAAGVLPAPLEHAEVLETTARVRETFAALLGGILGRL